MELIVIYDSKYGATKQYAEWISDELEIPVADTREVTPVQLAAYKCIIIGSPVYIGKLTIRKWLMSNKSILIHKRLFLFVVCSTELGEKKKLQTLINDSVPAEIRNQCDIFFLGGRIVYKKLSFLHKILINIRASFAKTPEEKALLYNMDSVDKGSLMPLMKAIVHYRMSKGEPA